ncbi:unnamed protein product [Phytophthora fragariaefolia]|uniref:Unnamed protein product n=1 Tax=Phytophthora fragariaefolia TaxID=1490495 RepID=A0A9W6YBN4_9STRA|nr:unnamed protein product [Phytophthora fragariaefolia]
MRFLSLLGVLALASSASVKAISDKTSIAKLNADVETWTRALTADHQLRRSLRRYADEDERLFAEKLDDVINKIDDKLAIVVHKPLKFPKGLKAAALEKADDVAAQVKAAMAKYPEELSASTLSQLLKIEQQRPKDKAVFAKMTKKTEDGMRRHIEPFPGMKTAPILNSHVGRAQQRFTDDGSRLLTCAVVSRSAKEGGGDVLLISSSNPGKTEWLLPKGGWDHGESVHKAAWREVMEEGGVNSVFKNALGDIRFQKSEVNKKTKETVVKKYEYRAYKMQGVTTYDQWAESVRYRIWVRDQTEGTEEWSRSNFIMYLVD